MQVMNDKANVGDLSSAYTQLELVKQKILSSIAKVSNIKIQEGDAKEEN